MGLFSNLFKSKVKKIVQTRLGQFTLSYSKKDKSIWSNNNGKYLLSVRGTEDQPNSEHINFIEISTTEIEKSNDNISRKFSTEFKEAGMEIDFKKWQERFIIEAIDIMLIFKDEAFWNISFGDLKNENIHFILFIEGQTLTDFSIDT